MLGGASANMLVILLIPPKVKHHCHREIVDVGTNTQKQLADSSCSNKGHYDLGSSSSDESSTR